MASQFRLFVAAPGFNAVGGLETFLSHTVHALSARGWDVHCMATSYNGDNVSDLQRIATCHDLSSLPLSPNKVFQAAQLINKTAPHILFMNHCPLAQYALPLLHRSIKPVSVIHSDDRRFYRTAAIFREYVFRWVAPTIKVAQDSHMYVGAKNRSRVSVIPHGIHLDMFHSDSRRIRPTGKIVFVGYIAENKGADLLPQIMQEITESHMKAHLTIVGYGPLRENLERQFQESGIIRNVTFTGPLSQHGVAQILRGADVLLLPTRIEGFGLSIAEAMLCGTVPVVTRIAGVTDQLIKDGRNGFLVKQDDVYGFAAAIRFLLSEKNRFQEVAECASREGKERFSLKRMIDDYERLFSEEDDRPKHKQGNKTGWFLELLPEVFRHSSQSDLLRKGKYLFR